MSVMRGERERRERPGLWRPGVREEVASELAFHVEMRVRELVARGWSEEAARAEALRRFGDIERVGAMCRDIGRKRERDMRRVAYWSELRQDARYAVRQLAHSPGFTAVAVLTLALGIGATAAIFSLVNAVVLRPFAWGDPERVVQVVERWKEMDGNVSAGNYVDWKAASGSFEAFGAIDWANFNLVEGDAPERVLGAFATHDVFDVFGVRPLLGRTFTAEEDSPGRDAVVVLSHALWRSRYGGDRDVVGRTLRLNDREYRVIGVMPEGFDPVAQGEQLWVPIAFTPERRQMHDEHYLYAVALLKPGVDEAAAQAEMDRIAEDMRQRYPLENQGRGIGLSSLSDAIVGNLRGRLLTLLAAVGLVLLIACANLANLLLARGAGRRTEIAIRASLGAGRGRVVRQLLTESLVLSLLTSVVGLVFAHGAVRVLVAASPPGVPRIGEAGIDGVVLAFAVLLGVACSVVFGLAPALRAARFDVQTTLREGARGAGAARVRDRLRTGLIAGEVALSLTLLVGAGLLVRSGIRLAQVDPGFDAEGVVTARVTLGPTAYGQGEPVRLAFARMVDALAASPAVAGAAASSQAPMGPGGNSNGLLPEGREPTPENGIDARLRIVTDDYFRVLRIPFVRGRGFGPADAPNGARVMVLSERAAQRLFPGEDAIGKRVRCCEGGANEMKTVVGIVRDVRSRGPAQDFYPEFYLPIAQAPVESFNWIQQTMTLVARARASDPSATVAAMRAAVGSVDPSLPLHGVTSMRESIREATAPARFNTMLLGALGFLGLLLATVGIASVIAYFVSLRTHEVGVRMALGAPRRSVLLLFALQVLRPVVLGLLAGIGLALAATRLLRSSLVGITPTDPATFAVVVAVFLACAAFAVWVPARKATRVQPARALYGG